MALRTQRILGPWRAARLPTSIIWTLGLTVQLDFEPAHAVQVIERGYGRRITARAARGRCVLLHCGRLRPITLKRPPLRAPCYLRLEAPISSAASSTAQIKDQCAVAESTLWTKSAVQFARSRVCVHGGPIERYDGNLRTAGERAESKNRERRIQKRRRGRVPRRWQLRRQQSQRQRGW
jgi:hypothetical protein